MDAKVERSWGRLLFFQKGRKLKSVPHVPANKPFADWPPLRTLALEGSENPGGFPRIRSANGDARQKRWWPIRVTKSPGNVKLALHA